MRWEKAKVEKAIEQIIFSKAKDLISTQISIGLDDRNSQAISAVLDRAFGKARQNIGIDGGATDKPIVFMPASLMDKYKILKTPVIHEQVN